MQGHAATNQRHVQVTQTGGGPTFHKHDSSLGGARNNSCQYTQSTDGAAHMSTPVLRHMSPSRRH